MCSIMGYCGSNADLNIFKKGFDRTITRGPDESRIIDTENGFLGFHRLAIMGLSPSGMQPFELDGSFVVCNGEIYGFEQFKEQLSEKYTFQSESDCEILLPLYREYKTDMFAMLDAEFACIIYDGETGEYIAARDPVGIRPLYYGFDEAGTLLLASEPKNLVGLAEAIMPFPPGHYYKNGEFICYCDIASSDTSVTMIWKPYTDRFMTNSLPVLKSGLSQMPRSDFFFPAGSIRHLYAPSQQGKALRQSRHSLSA